MDENFILYLIVSMIFLWIIYSFQRDFIEMKRISQKQDFKIKKMKIKRRIEQDEEEEDDDEEEDRGRYDVPLWLRSMAEGAGVDIDRLYDGDKEEIEKAKKMFSGDQGGLGGTILK